MGEELAKLEGMGERGGNRKSRGIVRLDNIGISKHQSSRWQLIAALPQKDFNNTV
jgi:hypothetical protein